MYHPLSKTIRRSSSRVVSSTRTCKLSTDRRCIAPSSTSIPQASSIIISPTRNVRNTNNNEVHNQYRFKSTVSTSFNIESFESTQEQQSQQQNNNNTTNNNPSQSLPYGNLFNAPINKTLLQKSASIRRTFTPQCNTQAMLICGGQSLAHNASFDPHYDRAVHYIRNHAVGPAVLSPVLIGGLVGTLVEAALPSSFGRGCSLRQVRPLIVGMEVEATIQVVAVIPGKESCTNPNNNNNTSNLKSIIHETKGYELILNTLVKRVSDGEIIAEGDHQVWLPDYS